MKRWNKTIDGYQAQLVELEAQAGSWFEQEEIQGSECNNRRT